MTTVRKFRDNVAFRRTPERWLVVNCIAADWMTATSRRGCDAHDRPGTRRRDGDDVTFEHKRTAQGKRENSRTHKFWSSEELFRPVEPPYAIKRCDPLSRKRGIAAGGCEGGWNWLVSLPKQARLLLILWTYCYGYQYCRHVDRTAHETTPLRWTEKLPLSIALDNNQIWTFEILVNLRCNQGRNEGGGSTIPRAPNNRNNVTSSLFNTVHLLAKDLRFEHGPAELASCPGRHLTSSRPWLQLHMTTQGLFFTRAQPATV